MSVLVKYIRNGSQPVGCVVAVKDSEGYVDIGWSYCSSEDQFSKSLARRIAIGRAKNGYSSNSLNGMKNKSAKEDVYNALDDMVHRAEKYFKTSVDVPDPIFENETFEDLASEQR